ncbi:MAG: abortive phage infection protein [Verrucomicrobiaceae bacterium]|nr:MAG: abortive phage infection protein [Verrucomicrobiaceae bacterium]
MSDLAAFATDLQQEVISRSETEGQETFLEGSFVQICLERLADAGELDDANVCLHRSTGLQVSGYAVSEDGESLDLLVAVHTNEVPSRTILKADMMDAFRRVTKFFEGCTKGYFKQIEEATPAFDLAQLVHHCWQGYSRVRFLLITDGICKNEPPPARVVAGLRASYDIWDAERFFRSWSSGREREEIVIDFSELSGGAVPCLALSNSEGGYSTLLSIFPGPLVAELYGKYGPRLLERNVRSFLQVKGSINKGIRDTIRREPSMFLPYNNGLSCTASHVELEQTESGASAIKSVRDLQIVNGGQTTASIYHASIKDKADVSQIGVQVKLTILDDASRMDEIVPLISKYANSQNKVQVADLMANDAFHRRIEELSRTIWAPARDGTLRQTRWFYERARGQYRDDIARERTVAQKKAFEAQNPKEQMFTKTDLAKYILSFEMCPHIVSKGAQYAFSAFTVGIEQHISREAQIDQAYFERLIAKGILFRETRRIAQELKLPTGYHAQIGTYTIAKLTSIAQGRVDLAKIWREQKLYPELERAIQKIARACYEHILREAAGGNFTQYCKREECWTSFRDAYVSLPEETTKSFATPIQNLGSESVQNQAIPVRSRPTDPVVSEAVALGAKAWIKVAEFAAERRLFSPKQLDVLTNTGLIVGEGKYPSKKVAEIALSLLLQAKDAGFSR